MTTRPTFCRQREWFFPHELTDGMHRVRVELVETAPDEAAIKASASKPITNPTPGTANRLTLSGVLVLGGPKP